MRQQKRKQIKALSIAASLLMTFSLIAPGFASAETRSQLHRSAINTNEIVEVKVSDRLQFKEDEKVTFLIKFKEQADTEKVAQEARASAENEKLSAQKTKLIQRSAVVSELKATSLESQQNVTALS